MKKFLKLVFILLLTQSLISCLGGDGGTTSANGGTSGTGISAGSITGFGSIFVNGVEFETTSSSITVDGQTGLSQSDLKIGMVVSVEGPISGNTGTAISVVAEDILEGDVDSIPDNNTLIVMGQTVTVDTTTLFDNNVPDFASINPGDTLEISGHVKDDGIIAATFIEKKLTAADYEVKGFVSSHIDGTKTFKIGTLTVNYSGAVIGDMPSPATSWNGLLVEVKGSSYDMATTTLVATKTEPEGLSLSDADEAEVEGFVTSIINANSFVLGNQTIQLNASTVFEGGLATDIAVGVKLEAEGSLVAGILTATEISFRDNVKIEANVETANAGTLTLSGLPSITVVVDDLTEYQGGLTKFGDIIATNHFRITGRVTSGNEIMATEIEDRGAADPRVILQAAVDSFSNPNVVLLGVTVDTSTIVAIDGFKNVSDDAISSATFFSSLSNGTLVKARGDLAGASITWDQVELEE